jgi:hypothetical protein
MKNRRSNAWLMQPVALLRPQFGLKAIRPPLLAERAH